MFIDGMGTGIPVAGMMENVKHLGRMEALPGSMRLEKKGPSRPSLRRRREKVLRRGKK